MIHYMRSLMARLRGLFGDRRAELELDDEIETHLISYAVSQRTHEIGIRMAIDRIPGLSVGFVKEDFTWSEGFGYADLENKTPAKAEMAARLKEKFGAARLASYHKTGMILFFQISRENEIGFNGLRSSSLTSQAF